MKKTIVALMTLAGVAFAESTISPLTDATAGSWTHSNKNTITDGVLFGDPNWQVDPSIYTLTSEITLGQDDVFSFSFDATNNGTGNGVLTLAFVGTQKAIVVGHGTYDKPADEIQLGITDELTAQGYVFANTNPTDDVQLTALTTLSGGMPKGGVTSTISGSIAWDGDSYAITINSSAVESAVSYDLGITSFDVSQLVVTIEGGATPTASDDAWKTATMSNLTISVASTTPAVPEPATATLSLLALAGLASRRRRK